MNWTDKIQVYNEDCMETMARYEDGWFDLAIVDPPYGLGKRTTDGGSKKNTQTKFMNDIRRSNWDDLIPNDEYFKELFRVSKNQIIWGGNYFPLPTNRCFIVWDKMTYPPTMSQVEQAWTNFDSPARLVKINSNQLDRQHPTQKPVALYNWILDRYAKPDFKILDTHLGSGSNAIACHHYGCELVAAELDTDYYNDSHKRFILNTAQQKLF